MNARTSSPTPRATLLLLGTLLFLAFGGTDARAQRAPGSIGLGGQIGDPSGITLKIYNGRSLSWDLLAAWDTNDFLFLNVHGVYERHLGQSPNVHFFYGPGAFVGIRDNDRRGEEDDVVAGISGLFGLGFLIERFEIYGAVTPRLAVTPRTEGDVGAGLGFRFYF